MSPSNPNSPSGHDDHERTGDASEPSSPASPPEPVDTAFPPPTTPEVPPRPGDASEPPPTAPIETPPDTDLEVPGEPGGAVPVLEDPIEEEEEQLDLSRPPSGRSSLTTLNPETLDVMKSVWSAEPSEEERALHDKLKKDLKGPPIGFVTAAYGKVEIKRPNGQWQEVPAGTLLEAGTTVRTGTNVGGRSSAAIQYHDGTVTIIGSRTNLSVEDPRKPVVKPSWWKRVWERTKKAFGEDQGRGGPTAVPGSVGVIIESVGGARSVSRLAVDPECLEVVGGYTLPLGEPQAPPATSPTRLGGEAPGHSFTMSHGVAYRDFDGEWYIRVTFTVVNTGEEPIEVARESVSAEGMDATDSSSFPQRLTVVPGVRWSGDRVWTLPATSSRPKQVRIEYAPADGDPWTGELDLVYVAAWPAQGQAPRKSLWSVPVQPGRAVGWIDSSGDASVSLEVTVQNPSDIQLTVPLRYFWAKYGAAGGADGTASASRSSFGDAIRLPPGESSTGWVSWYWATRDLPTEIYFVFGATPQPTVQSLVSVVPGEDPTA